MSKALGIDIGGTGTKGAIVDLSTGELVSEKIKYATPAPKDPEAIFGVVKQIHDDLNWDGKIGIGFPARIHEGYCGSAANVHADWLNFPITEKFSELFDQKVSVLNDADAAGLAEVKYGIGQNVEGTVLLMTLGTGIGSGLFTQGILVPNTEMGHLKWRGDSAEHLLSNRARKVRELDWEQWGTELGEFLEHVCFLFSPHLLILGGGVSKRFEEYSKYFNLSTPVVPAEMKNNAGIVGAAWSAHSSTT